MSHSRCFAILIGCSLALAIRPGRADNGDLPAVAARSTPGQLAITVAGQPVATYVYRDKSIRRPYFAHVKAPGGTQVTRNHPPIEGRDRTDHATMHPGIWMAFGDLGGEDFWRNKGRVVHEAFVEKPAGGGGKLTFAVRNRYRQANGDLICREVCRLTFLIRPSGYLLMWDSTFSADESFYFGDQEEMGLGVRVATPISVAAGGTMLDAERRRNEGEIWGNAADWCDYGGTVDGRNVGMTLMCHPDNFRPCWLHARDYGFVTANPFGRQAFRKGPPSRVFVRPGDEFRLRFGVLLHAGQEFGWPELKAAYADYVRLTSGVAGHHSED